MGEGTQRNWDNVGLYLWPYEFGEVEHEPRDLIKATVDISAPKSSVAIERQTSAAGEVNFHNR